METTERCAILKAVLDMVKAAYEEAREELDGEFAEQYDAYGVEKIALKVSGEKVGELSLQYHKDGFVITDKEAFDEFALSYGLASTKRSIRPEMVGAAIKVIEGVIEPDHVKDFVSEEVVVVGDWEKYMVRAGDMVLFLDSGMEVPGVRYRPKAVKGTRITGCKPEVVGPIIRSLPGGINALLLGGAE